MLEMKLCGDPVLREVAATVLEINDGICAALRQMILVMEEKNGVGLAAPQVGILLRLLVMKEPGTGNQEPGDLICMINPAIVERSEDMVVLEEGCLSVLGDGGLPVFADVARPESVTLEWTDEHGQPHSRKFSGIAARIVQHEIDHLDGILFIDYLSSAKREMVMNKVKKRKI